MLFSQPQVANLLNEGFECAWESVRDVPKITIDFGGGTVLQRTLVGNIATWFCFADGEAFGVLPGLVDASELLASASAALQAHGQTNAGRGPDARRLARESLLRRVAAASPTAPTRSVSTPAARQFSDLSKSLVEDPLRRAAGMPPASAAVPDVSKRAVEQPLRVAAGVPDAADVVAADTAFNRAERFLAAQLLLHERAPVTPHELRDELFDRILHVPLLDPFLGLAPMTAGGEGGRTVGGVASVPLRAR